MKPLAERLFTGKNGTQVSFKIYSPYPQDGIWKCDYEINFQEARIKRSFGFGQDSLQALLVAVGKAKVYLTHSNACKELGLQWDDYPGLDLDV